MLMTLTLLSLVSQIPYGVSFFHACIPNSQFHMNGRLCLCDAVGRWDESSCEVSRRQNCKPGQIIWEGCSQCICQENGHMMCTNTMCGEDATSKPSQNKVMDVKRLWCIPFMSYYVNCSLCVCPASGKMNDARCASDASCPFRGVTDYLTAVKSNDCIPKVMYLFPCLHCVCSEDGLFIISKCVETCKKAAVSDVARRCIPRTFHRIDCNVCYCPENSVPNDNLCTKTTCSQHVRPYTLVSLRNQTKRCQRQTFTEPKCFYCECSNGGIVNEKACLESECMSIDNFKYDFERATCNPGEMVLKCMECFCLRNGATDPKYCTKACSNQQKLSILEMAIKESITHRHIIDRQSVKQIDSNEVCEPYSIYKEQGRYCLCPMIGNTNAKLCTPVVEDIHAERTKISIRGTTVSIDFNVKCDPNTFVEFDCNSCYCLKTGRIDPKWCTYDDCEAKRIILEKQKSERLKETSVGVHEACVPGAISKESCNFCICPENGKIEDKACTKISCAGIQNKVNSDFACEPLSYYNVDCNICFCPKNGIKNVAKCTKITCEKNFLRSEICVPGRLFSEECNVCVCPPNGDKNDRVCTNNTCTDSDTPWKKIFQLSQSLMSYQKIGDTTRNLELCFPGEEFEVGCKVCLCPDMGLRVYATCTQMLCNDKELPTGGAHVEKPRIARREDCINFDSSEQKACTPGSMYIIRCKECICPYMGSVNHFCRPMPYNMHCEEAFPGFNYLPMGRRDSTGNETTKSPTTSQSSVLEEDHVTPHTHTRWACDVSGRLMDECFICECEGGYTIQEHCFRSEQKSCEKSQPTFLKNIILPEG